MSFGTQLMRARTAAGLSQRELARRAGVPQSTVGRIETGAMIPRVDTLQRLLRQCGAELRVAPRPGAGVDRTQLRERLKLSPTQRVEDAVAAARALAAVRGRAGAPIHPVDS